MFTFSTLHIPWKLVWRHLLIAIFLFYAIFLQCADARCEILSALINCRFDFPDYGQIKPFSEVIVKKYNGPLKTEAPEDGLDEHSVSSLTITNSFITSIQPRFFARFSAGALQNLILTSNNGTLELNEHSIGGLENTLKKVRVYSMHLKDVDYLTKLSNLKTLTLVKIGLKQLPLKFDRLLVHLETLDLSDNQLTTMPWDMIAKRLEDYRFVSLRLENNKWICDCRMQPLIEASLDAKNKVTGIYCPSRDGAINIPLIGLKLSHVCDPSGNKDKETATENPNKPDVTEDKYPQQPDPNLIIIEDGGNDQIAAAGLSVEVIAVVACLAVVLCIVAVALIVFKIRSRNQRRLTQGTRKQTTHKNTNYAHVTETEESVDHRSYNNDMNNVEKQPLAPSYRTDHRL